MITEFLVTTGEARKRLDLFLLGRERDMTRSRIQRLISLGRIRINARMVKPGHKIKPGDRITFDTPQAGPLLVNDQPTSLEILLEDEAILVVNKPPGTVVHPTSGNWNGTLFNAILQHLHNTSHAHQPGRPSEGPGIVHRLDKDTSGVMVIAKTSAAHRGLTHQFERHSIRRTYEALVWGIPETIEGKISLAIGRDCKNPKIVSTHSDHPKPAITHYSITERFGNTASLVRLFPQTGRTHQLRVHMASIGCPLLGDGTYGGVHVSNLGGIEIPRVMLHARLLGFQHPISGDYGEYEVNFPKEMIQVCSEIRRQARL